MELTKENLLEMYRKMVRIRLFELSLPHYFEEGYIVGTGHASMGEEAVAVGACSALDENDYVMSTTAPTDIYWLEGQTCLPYWQKSSPRLPDVPEARVAQCTFPTLTGIFLVPVPSWVAA